MPRSHTQPQAKPRLLFLSPWCPYPADNGSRLRIYHLLRGLSLEYDITLIAFMQPDTDQQLAAQRLAPLCQRVVLVPQPGFNRYSARALAGFLALRPRWLVDTFSPRVASLVRELAPRHALVVASQLGMAPYLRYARNTPVLLEELELTLYHQRAQRSARERATWLKLRLYLSSLLVRAAGCSVASEHERKLVLELAPADLPIVVVPNGVDTAYSTIDAGEPELDSLIYHGALSYDANADAVAYFLADILPLIRAERPAAQLIVTGRVDPAHSAALAGYRGLLLTGYLPDIRERVARSWAAVVPLRRGGGTRLKVLEALALGTPVISTAKGIEGLDLRPGVEVLAAETPAEFAAAVLRVLHSPELRRQLAAAGRAAVQRYDWRFSVAALTQALEIARATEREAR